MTFKRSMFESKMMSLALEQAEIAASKGEIPVGCVIVVRVSREVIVRTHNMMQQGKNANLHAEILAINQACQKLEDKNLSDCDIYVSLEPCTMCASAIANARIGRLYYAASDTKQGAVENGVKFFASSSCFHRPEIYPDIQGDKSEQIIKNFFSRIREKK